MLQGRMPSASRDSEPTSSRRERRGGFTLLEVMVAISILGLSLTVILSAQAGLFSSAARATHLTVAVGLARCKMNEVEFELGRDGYPLLDQRETGACCDDEDIEGYRCAWKVELVELPHPSLAALDYDADGADSQGDGPAQGPLSKLMSLQQGSSSLGLGETPELGDLASSLTEGEGVGGLASMAMSLVYPQLKPMLEASIRKLTVTVTWQEGKLDRDLAVTQYVTDPRQGGLDPEAAAGVEAQQQQLQQLLERQESQ